MRHDPNRWTPGCVHFNPILVKSANGQARTPLVTARSEVHANATMFGDIASTSFKSKWKHVDRRGRAILKAIAAREGVRMAA